MALYKSETATGRKPVFSLIDATGGQLRYEYVITANLAAGDVIHMGNLPANRVVPLSALLISDDLDSNGTPTITLSAGVLNADKTAIGAGPNDQWFSAVNIGQTGGIARPTTNAVFATGPSEFVQRPLGVVVVAGPATALMIGKKIVLVVEVNG